MKCNRCGATEVQNPCPYSDVPCEPRMTLPDGDWEGNSPRTCREHRTTGPRAWCFDDHTWCYPHDPCAGCRTLQDEVNDAIDLLQANGYIVVKEGT